MSKAVLAEFASKLRQSRLRPAIALTLVIVPASLWGKRTVDVTARSPEAALCTAMAARGFAADPLDVLWLDDPAPASLFRLRRYERALVRARVKDEPADLYLVDTTRSPEGVLLDLGEPWNLTRSASVDEGRPVRSGPFVAYAADLEGQKTSIHLLDVRGRPAPDDFTRTQRAQVALTQAQSTGQLQGIAHDVYVLSPSAERLQLSFAGGHVLVAEIDGKTARIDASTGAMSGDTVRLRPSPEEKARPPSVVPWAVDRVRAVSWFGEEKMQWVKAIAFTGLEYISDLSAKGKKDQSASQIADDLGGIGSGTAQPESFTDPEIGWPPAPMKAVLSPPLPGEGQWIALEKDPFITDIPGSPAPFVTSVIRTDPRRPFTRVYVTMWDPRQIALHMEAGTVEPVSATGEAGPGVIPRTPEIMRRVVAGFNGGFQAMHGEFGMQANGINYLPPKPYAATVMELRDGSTAFGVWPKSSDVPDEVMSYRQNLTALVQNGKFNVWGRTWWGGTPIGWPDNIHTTRSGVCLTKEGFVGYFYGQDIAPDVIAQAMIAARCDFGIHLDMNPGLAGFEFYNIQPVASFKPLGRPLQGDWEQEGLVKDLPEFRFRARRMIKSMTHMNFPQYIHRHGRDFFYLTARHVLPGAELAAATPKVTGDGVWKTKGLPQFGFPYALATTTLHPQASPQAVVRALRIDPRQVAPQGSSYVRPGAPTVLVFSAKEQSPELPQGKPGAAARDPRAQGNVGLFHARGVFLLDEAIPEAARAAGQTSPLLRGVRASSPLAKDARAAVGVSDEDGMLTWVELAPNSPTTADSAKLLDGMLARAGCSNRMILIAQITPLLGGAMDISGERVPSAGAGPRLVRAEAPSARGYFLDTPIVAPEVWLPLQAQRVRYFRKLPPQGSSSAVPKATGSSAPSSAPTAPPATAPTTSATGNPAPAP